MHGEGTYNNIHMDITTTRPKRPKVRFGENGIPPTLCQLGGARTNRSIMLLPGLNATTYDQTKHPCSATEDNLPNLKQYLLDRYASSTFNICEHQPLPLIKTSPPLELFVDPAAAPKLSQQGRVGDKWCLVCPRIVPLRRPRSDRAYVLLLHPGQGGLAVLEGAHGLSPARASG